jgi:hypothetical protein
MRARRSVTTFGKRRTGLIGNPSWTSRPYFVFKWSSDPNIFGTFVYHCHLLKREESGVMGKIQTLPPGTRRGLAVLTFCRSAIRARKSSPAADGRADR